MPELPGVSVAVTELLKLGLVGALLIIFGLVIRYLYLELKDCRVEGQKNFERALTAIESSAKAMGAIVIEQAGFKDVMEARTRATEQVAQNVVELRHAFDLAVLNNTNNTDQVKMALQNLNNALEALRNAK